MEEELTGTIDIIFNRTSTSPTYLQYIADTNGLVKSYLTFYIDGEKQSTVVYYKFSIPIGIYHIVYELRYPESATLSFYNLFSSCTFAQEVRFIGF